MISDKKIAAQAENQQGPAEVQWHYKQASKQQVKFL